MPSLFPSASTFSWLDYSEHDRRAALDLIDQFRERDTRDELGIGAIRDGFSDLFFPGTSTVQTRARYFLFVPWIYQQLERKKVASDSIARRARSDEAALIQALLDSGETEGVIGREVGAKLKRLPSNIYWQGLGRLGIRRFQGSQDQYHRSLDRFYGAGGLQLRDHDGELVNPGGARNWIASLPPAPAGFPDGATFDLTRAESIFLRERVTQTSPHSLFRFLADLDGEVPPDPQAPWEHPAVARAPARLRAEVEHARCFSEVMHGAALLYNLLLARLRRIDEWVAEYEELLHEWTHLMAGRAGALANWNRTEFWNLVGASGARVTMPTRAFVDRWVDFALSDQFASVAKSSRAERMICDREIILKHGQARVRGGRALELWEGASGTAQLTYRWGIASRILADLQEPHA